MKHPIYYIIAAAFAVPLSIWFLRSLLLSYAQPQLWLAIITVLILGMLAISVSMFIYSRKLRPYN